MKWIPMKWIRDQWMTNFQQLAYAKKKNVHFPNRCNRAERGCISHGFLSFFNVGKSINGKCMLRFGAPLDGVTSPNPPVFLRRLIRGTFPVTFLVGPMCAEGILDTSHAHGAPDSMGMIP